MCDLEYTRQKDFGLIILKRSGSMEGRFSISFWDEGWRFIFEKYPHPLVFPLGRKVMGVRRENIVGVRRPEERLKQIIKSGCDDELIHALKEFQGLPLEEFGVFGSLLHCFYILQRDIYVYFPAAY